MFSISKANRSSMLICISENDFQKCFSIWSSYLQSKSTFFSMLILFKPKINMEFLCAFGIWFFILRFSKNAKISMEQLFVVQMSPFLEGAPRGCELHGNLVKHKAWGGSLGALNCTMWSQGAKKASPDLMFYKVSAKFATLRIPCQKSINLDNK